ncbi:MAG: hypothetical protein RB191_11495 [Terriglobia bacterium]|nr:hypothetical protein [Terriglobia bacterium]
MPIVTTLILPNPAPLVSTFVKVEYQESAYGFDITGVELHHDAACTKLAADFCIDELPRETQDRIYSAIDHQRYCEARARGLRRLKADLESDLYAKQLIDGARA